MSRSERKTVTLMWLLWSKELKIKFLDKMREMLCALHQIDATLASNKYESNATLVYKQIFEKVKLVASYS